MSPGSRFPGPGSARRLRLAVLPATVVAAEDALLRRRLAEALAAKARPSEIDEMLLQALLFAGVPRTINAFHVWRDLRTGVPRRCAPGTRKAGARLFRRIYGPHARRVLAELRSLHPDLLDFALGVAYGRVLSRGGVPAVVRELAAVPALIASGALRQLSSHVRGARTLGAGDAEILRALRSARGLAPPPRLAEAASIVRRTLAAIARPAGSGTSRPRKASLTTRRSSGRSPRSARTTGTRDRSA